MVAYRVMKRLDDNRLISPYAISIFIEESIDQNDNHKIIPYGFCFFSYNSSFSFLKNYTEYNAKLEIWSVNIDNYIIIQSEPHPYQLFKKYDDKNLISESLINDKKIKIGYVNSPKDTIFCQNISLAEQIYKNYE